MISQLAGNSDTDGAFDLVESKMKKGTEPPPHIHDREDEFFYILAGEIKVFADGQVFTVAAGESVFLPKKIPHAYLIQSEECHVLALMTPGGFLNAINKMNAPARTMEIPSDMETYATADLTATRSKRGPPARRGGPGQNIYRQSLRQGCEAAPIGGHAELRP